MTGDAVEMRTLARTLGEVAHVLAAADDADARVEAALGLVKQVVPYECCALLEVVPRNGRCELTTVPELSPERRATLRTRLVTLLRLIGEDEPADVGAERVAGPAAEPDTRMHLAIPVIGLNRIIGVLFVEQPGEYDEHSLRLLSVIAAQLGSYLTTVRMREEEIEQARQLGVALQRLEETDRRKDEFLAMLGHELRNPLGAINTALRVIDQTGVEDATRYHRVIDRQIHHLSRIVDDLLDASRVRLGKVHLEHELIDLRSIAERWREAFGGSELVRAHVLRWDLAETPLVVEGDMIRLEQVFSNIVTNALKYTPAGGEIAIRIHAEAGHGVISVRDAGIGMSPRALATVFELFTQADDSLARSQGGLGVGLPLARGLVERHGGTITASSDGPGKGSEFVVRLPLSNADQKARTAARPPPARHAEVSLRILVIEDNDDACQMLSELLGAWGHHVDCAGDGLTGVARGLAGVHDVLLVDIGLPKIDGYEVARQIRRGLGTNGPALFAMTGYGQPQDRRRALEAGFDAHLVKPVNAFDLEECLATVTPRAARDG